MGGAGRARLGEQARGEQAKLRYTYDFGDNWPPEEILPVEARSAYSAYLAGRRA